MKKHIFTLALLTLLSLQSHAGWMANADYSSCPRKYLPDTSRSEGPFNSESDCLSKLNAVKNSQNLSCARYSCVNQGGAGGESSSAAAGHEMDTHIGNAISTGLQGDISTLDAAGLVSMGLLGNALLAPGTPARQKSSAELEAERIAAENAAIVNARYERERQARRDQRVAPMFALLDPIPALPSDANAGVQGKSDSYSKGFEHASQCISQNAGTACVGASADQQESCVNEYRTGFDSGSKQKKLALQEAFQAGQGAAIRGEKDSSFTDKRAQGPCRLEWIDSYKQGFMNNNGKKGL